MIEVRENLPLITETREHRVGVHAAFDHLDGYMFPVLVVIAGGQVNRAHPAAANFAEHAIGSQAFSGKRRIDQQSCFAFHGG